MSSKRRIRRRSCEGKTKYKTRNAAKVAIHTGNHKGFMLPYKCKFCKQWHVGRPNKNRRKAYWARKRQSEREKT